MSVFLFQRTFLFIVVIFPLCVALKSLFLVTTLQTLCLFVLSFTWIKTPLCLDYLKEKSRAVAKQQRDRRAHTQTHMKVQSLSMPPRFDAHPPLHHRKAGDSFKQTQVLLKPDTLPFPPPLSPETQSKEGRSFRTLCVRLRTESLCARVPVRKRNLINDGAAPSNLGQTHHVFCENTQRL